MAINIGVTPLVDGNATAKLKPMASKMEGIVLYCDPALFTCNDVTAFTEPASTAWIKGKFSSENGCHYSIDSKQIGYHVPVEKSTNHLRGGHPTYIENAMFNGKANECTIGVMILMPLNQKYDDIERVTIKFLASLINKYGLTTDAIWRGFDLNREGSPLHMFDKTNWPSFLKAVNDTAILMQDKNSLNDDSVKYRTFFPDDVSRKIYYDNIATPDRYIDNNHYEIDPRGIKKILDFKADKPAVIKQLTSKNKNDFSYTVVENPPTDTSHCNRATDVLTVKATPNTLTVEPIYPDIVIPPGGTSIIVDQITPSDETIVKSNVSLEETDLNKRQKSFNIRDYKGAKKDVKGKPVNNNDPFPVDTKIKELESHTPKVKIDEADFVFNDTNHPGSVIGASVAKNFAMIQDEFLTLSKRTEVRLVKLENNMSTIMRNLFRVGSRMNINCVYYGGQDVFSGKYKCIRCLHDDRINDGQSMTLDQCLSCTRYEPILGQVYAILEDDETNISQVLDDMQMAYMNIDDYATFTRTENIHFEKKEATPKAISKEPKAFKDIWKEGFKMNWNDTVLETQRPKVAEYKSENIEANKPVLKADNQGSVEKEFKDTIDKNESYETVKFSTENYAFEDFSQDTIAGFDDNFGYGASEIRKKIVAYAQNAVDMCKAGKAGYSQANRYAHLDKAINGISYWDCSSLVEGAYKAAGINSIAGNTYTEYPVCKPSTGGTLISVKDMSKALPGDIVFYTSQRPLPSNSDELNKADIDQVHHVGIYIGNGQLLNARTDNVPLREQISLSEIKYNQDAFSFGRPKALVDADKKAADLMAAGKGFFDMSKQGFPDWIITEANKEAKNDAESTCKWLRKCGYGPGLVDLCKKYGYDPYQTLGQIATESSGIPTQKGVYYWGLLGTYKSNTRATANLQDILHDINVSMEEMKQKHDAVRAIMPPWKDNMAARLYAYNAGEGTLQRAYVAMGRPKDANTTAGQMAQPMAEAGKAQFHTMDKYHECGTYVAKIILRANILRQMKALE